MKLHYPNLFSLICNLLLYHTDEPLILGHLIHEFCMNLDLNASQVIRTPLFPKGNANINSELLLKMSKFGHLDREPHEVKYFERGSKTSDPFNVPGN